MSFSLGKGLHVILGRNGSGKTTLFRALCGVITPQSGQAELDGVNLLTLAPKKRARKVAAVLNSHRSVSGITGQALSEMALYAKSDMFMRPGKQELDRIRLIAGEMKISYLLDTLLENMSAGERQLLSLLSAEVQDTPLMLLDEPTSSLDYNRIHEFMTRAKANSKEKILVCTLHDPSLALRYADSILMIDEGKLICSFAPGQVSAEEAEKNLRLIYPSIHVFNTDRGLYAE